MAVVPPMKQQQSPPGGDCFLQRLPAAFSRYTVSIDCCSPLPPSTAGMRGGALSVGRRDTSAFHVGAVRGTAPRRVCSLGLDHGTD